MNAASGPTPHSTTAPWISGQRIAAWLMLTLHASVGWFLTSRLRVTPAIVVLELLAAGAVVAFLYSALTVRLRSLGGVEWIVSAIGLGSLTPLVGWALATQPFRGPAVSVIWAFTPLCAALAPLMQLHSIDDDRANGVRSVAVRLGARRSLSVATFGAGIGFGMLTMAGWQSHWHEQAVLRWGALAVAALSWAVVLVPWYRHAREWSTQEHRQAKYHALAAWVLTDIAVLLAWAT
jgi:4-hydroxybenzoate polyprenyltransferase